MVILYFSSAIAYVSERKNALLDGIPITILIWFNDLFLCLRIASNIIILVIELTVFPVGILFGMVFDPIAMKFLADYLCSLSYHFFCQSGCTARHITVTNSVYCQIKCIHQCWFGKVLWFETKKPSDACYVVSILKLQQRYGTGLEGI